MVTIKAKGNFGGLVTMSKGEVKSVEDWIATDLIKAGFAEKVGDEQNGKQHSRSRKSDKLPTD